MGNCNCLERIYLFIYWVILLPRVQRSRQSTRPSGSTIPDDMSDYLIFFLEFTPFRFNPSRGAPR
jgi:hypothetical protein